MLKKEIGIGILGLGTIGSGTLSIIEKNQDFIESEIAPYKVKITGLVDLELTRKPTSGKYDSIFTSSAQQVIEDAKTQIIVEAIGGEYPAYNLIKNALNRGKHVVTPNKEVVAKHGYELLNIAHDNKVQFLFETSVASAIPVIGIISNMLTSCPLEEITGILNGTTNYMLDLMLENNMTQEEALKKAQDIGYAEADPSNDILGIDTLYKIFILSSLGFRAQLDIGQISYSGIDTITYEDILLTKQLGYRIKLLAIAIHKGTYLDIRVQPVLVDKDHILANIHSADNGILMYGKSYGELFFSGAGAGGTAGGSMIVSDIIRIIRQPEYFEFGYLVQNLKKLEIKLCQQQENEYFLRIQLEKEKDCRGKIKEIIEQNNGFIEKSSEIGSETENLTIGILTNKLSENKINKIIKEIEHQKNCVKMIHFLRIYKNIRK